MNKFSKTYKIDFYQTGADRKLNLFSLMNMIQDIASDHAALLGFGHDQLDEDTYWVLVRQIIQMDYWPEWREEITFETFISKPVVGTPPRDLLIYHKNKLIGRGQTSWLVIDGKTRKIATQKIDMLLDAAISESSGVKTHKVLIQNEGMIDLKKIDVQYSDLDMNLHVNNAIYGQWVMNCIDIETWKNWQISEFSINYLQEILPQDQVFIKRNVNVGVEGQEVLIEGKVKDSSKAAFTALLKLVKKV